MQVDSRSKGQVLTNYAHNTVIKGSLSKNRGAHISLDILDKISPKPEDNTVSPKNIRVEFKTNYVDHLQKNCFDLYAKIFLQIDTIEQVSMLSQENHQQASENKGMKILIAKMVENALTIVEHPKKILHEEKSEVYAEIAKVIADYDLERALNMANQIEDIDWKSYALTRVVEKLAEENTDQALEIANSIPVDLYKAKALAKVSSCLADNTPEEAAKIINSALAAAEKVAEPFDKFEALLACLYVQSKMDASAAAKLENQLIRHIADFNNKSDTERWCTSKALSYFAEYIAQKDPARAQQLLEQSYGETVNLTTPIRKIDCLALIYKIYEGLDPKKAKKIFNEIQQYMASSNHEGVKALGATKVIDKVPFRKHKQIDALIKQGRREVLLMEDPSHRGFVQSRLAKVQAAFYPTQAIKDAKEIDSHLYRAIAYSYIAQSLLVYYS